MSCSRWLACVVLCLAAESQAANDRPNILLAISDDQCYPYASAYGCSGVRTPAFDRVASQGVLFKNAYGASPGCSPCRAALLTGRHCWQIEQAGTHASSFPLRYRCYPELLAEAGYFVGHTGKGWGPGNFKIDGRTENPAGPAFSRVKNPPPAKGMSATDYAANFQAFLKARPPGQPFCFWYGGQEPHRAFEKGSGLKAGKELDEAFVPSFLPDTPEVRSDILDYCLEIEWFDTHLGRMLDALAEAGELDRTLVIVTSDNGMAFPRAKANGYDFGIHMPLAIAWPQRVPGGRTSTDLVGFVDLTATILEAAGVDLNAAAFNRPERQLAGRSLLPLLSQPGSGRLDPTRTAVFASRERHSSSRYQNLGYPIRSMRTPEYLYVRNFRPDRSPAGDPQTMNGDQLGKMHGGYHDIDASPTLDHLVELRDDPTYGRFLRLAVDARPAVEIFDVINDPGCLVNLAGRPEFAATQAALTAQFEETLRRTGDPRLLASDGGDVFETYPRFSAERRFPEPAAVRAAREQLEADGWIRLFDGESLSGWRVAGPEASFEVVNGSIQAHVPSASAPVSDSGQPMAHLYYVGPDGQPGTADDDFTNFELRMETLATPGSNGGVYFHTSWQPDGFPNDGHEVQVNNSHTNKIRTGSLFGVANREQSPVADNAFCTLQVTVQGKRVRVTVDGTETVDYTEPEDYRHPRYTERNVDHGTFALQAHDPESWTYYRSIRVRRLP